MDAKVNTKTKTKPTNTHSKLLSVAVRMVFLEPGSKTEKGHRVCADYTVRVTAFLCYFSRATDADLDENYHRNPHEAGAGAWSSWTIETLIELNSMNSESGQHEKLNS